MTRTSLHAFAVSGAFVMLLSACGGSPAAEPSTTAPASSTAAPSSAPATPAASAAGSPTTAGSASSKPAASASAKPAGSAATSSATSATPAAGGIKLTIAPDANSQVDITVREILAGATVKTDAVESSKAVSGTIGLDAGSKVSPDSRLTLDLRTLKSDRNVRDGFIKGRFVLNTDQFPNAEFVPKEVQGLTSVPATGEATFKLLGDATVHGVTKPMTWDVKATFDGQTVKGEATTDFKFADFSISVPKVPSVAELEDGGKIKVTFQAARANS